MTVAPPRIYAIADAAALGAARLARAVAEIAAAGVGWIQLRVKSMPDDELYALVAACHEAVAGGDCELWMNDRADVAALFPFRGVHLGQADLEPAAARAVVGRRLLVGRSTHNLEQVRRADADPAIDVIAYGPVYSTRSKKNPDPPVGLHGLRAARAATRKPLVAIGGIDADTVGPVLAAGADSAAMIGAVCRGDIGANCRRLQQAVAGGHFDE